MVALLLFTVSKSESVTLLCSFGLAIILICIHFFVKLVVQSQSLEGRIRYLDSLQNPKGDKFDKYLLQVEKFFARYGSTKSFKLASLNILFAHIFTKLLLDSGTGELASYFMFSNWDYGFFLLIILPFLFGILSDIRNRSANQLLTPSLSTNSLYFLGALEFFKDIVIYLTGLLGNRDSFLSIKSIDDLIPFESLNLFTTDWFNFNHYTQTSAYNIYAGLGLVKFSFIYLLLPILVIIFYYVSKRSYRLLLPIDIVKSAHQVSVLMLIIPIYIGWHEDWIKSICDYFR